MSTGATQLIHHVELLFHRIVELLCVGKGNKYILIFDNSIKHWHSISGLTPVGYIH